MKLLNTLFAFFCLSITLGNIINTPIGSELVVRADDSQDYPPTLEALDEYLKELVAVVTGVEPQDQVANYSSLSKRATENQALTAALVALNRSGQGVQIVHGLATNPLSQPSTIDLIEQYIINTGLTKILSAADGSDLAVSLVMRFFINPALIPNLWNILVTLWNNGVIGIPGFSKRLILDLVGDILGGIQQSIVQSVLTLFNAITDLESICISVNKSGIGVSIVDDLLTTSDGQTFVVRLITSIVNNNVITFSGLISALQDSGVVVNTFTKIIADSNYRKIIFIWAVQQLVAVIQYIF
ncbi:unnamed protein product [Candida verbasci]|uniref:Uncharacterized protein n=1 Tax=Candida verbasci TaxID=1227364 RepID=A0A9W4XM85_9ASCO|nr:unnamed protein product [Candida verbasci]